jgi:hypothetical protein
MPEAISQILRTPVPIRTTDPVRAGTSLQRFFYAGRKMLLVDIDFAYNTASIDIKNILTADKRITGETTALNKAALDFVQETANSTGRTIALECITKHPTMITWGREIGQQLYQWDTYEEKDGTREAVKMVVPQK